MEESKVQYKSTHIQARSTTKPLTHPHRTEISLGSYTAANHWLVLIFYPKAWSFVCPTEIKAFSARLEEFLYSRSCAVAFASTDNEHSLKAWNAASDLEGGLGGIHVPLISDSNHQLCRDYGVLIEKDGVAQRALFIVDPKGMVRGVTVNDADIGRSVDETLRIIDALAFKDEFGEGCPVDWKKGDKGIDVGSKTQPEPHTEFRVKSWTDWARPKLGRAFSGASQRSIGGMSIKSVGNADGVVPTLSTMQPSTLNLTSAPQTPGTGTPRSGFMSGSNSPAPSATRPGPMRLSSHSPILSPTSHVATTMEQQMEAAMEQQRFENMQAVLANQNLNQGVGMASQSVV